MNVAIIIASDMASIPISAHADSDAAEGSLAAPDMGHSAGSSSIP